MNERNRMKNALSGFSHRLRLSVILFVAIAFAARGADIQKAIIPQIVLDNVPLSDAIRSLARQANINYILDPRSPGSVGLDGRLVEQPTVSGRWTNVTARQALDLLLTNHDLVLIENPVTTVARVAPKQYDVKPVAANLVAGDTNNSIPLIQMQDVPLDAAIVNLARQAQINAALDPAAPGFSITGPAITVSIRWNNVTARQALVALLDNYDLTMVEDTTTAVTRITTRER